MLPSFEKYYLNDALVDVSVTLFEEADELGKRKRETQIPAHSMVLAVTSSYCEAKVNLPHNLKAAALDLLSPGGWSLLAVLPVL